MRWEQQYTDMSERLVGGVNKGNCNSSLDTLKLLPHVRCVQSLSEAAKVARVNGLLMRPLKFRFKCLMYQKSDSHQHWCPADMKEWNSQHSAWCELALQVQKWLKKELGVSQYNDQIYSIVPLHYHLLEMPIEHGQRMRRNDSSFVAYVRINVLRYWMRTPVDDGSDGDDERDDS
jgi:hypothetical protein